MQNFFQLAYELEKSLQNVEVSCELLSFIAVWSLKFGIFVFIEEFSYDDTFWTVKIEMWMTSLIDF